MSVEIPSDWQAALRHVLSGQVRRVLVLGARDAGKTTFCGMVASQAAIAGPRPAILDADPGQKQVGPPACVSLGRATNDVLFLSGLVYLDTVEPLRGWSRLVAGSAFLAANAHSDLAVVNTCGLLRGPGRRLKGAMISALRPDLLVAIGEDWDLEAVLADHPDLPAMRLCRPVLARRKGEGERRALRRIAFQSYFELAPVWMFFIDAVRLESMDGTPFPQPGRIVALADAAGHDLVLGLVLSRDATGNLQLRAPRPDRAVACIRWGRLGLDEAWQEQRAVSAVRSG